MRVAQFAIFLGLLASGCASVVDGDKQEITVATEPGGASCVFYRKGVAIGEITQTPSSVLVEKTKRDIEIVCNKPGYQELTYLNQSRLDNWVLGNAIIPLGLVDTATGADNQYDQRLLLRLAPVDGYTVERAKPAS